MNTRKKSIRGAILPNLIDKLCFNIAQHLRSVAEDKIIIDRLTLHFKIDPKGMMNFLFCSYIHFTDQTLGSEAQKKTLFCEPNLKNPSNALDTNLLLTGRPMSLQKQYFCVSCENRINVNKIYEIKLKSISKHHIASRLLNESAVRKGSDELNPVSMMHDIEQNMKQLNTAHSDEEDGEGRRKKGTDQTRKIGNVVPPEIYNTFPNINKMAYLKLQRDISFQEGVVPVCEECYLYLTSLNEASGSERLKKYFILKDNLELEGTGRLKPESLKLRSEDTRLRIKDDEIARFNRERLIKQLEENEQKVKRFLESKGRGMASFRQWQPNATDAFLRAADHHTSSQQATDRKAALFKRALPRVEKSPHKTDRTEGSTRYSSTVLQMAGPRTGIADRIFSKLGQEEASTERTCHSPRTEGFASLRKAISSQQIVGFRDRQGIDSKRASIPSKAENKGPASTHRTVHAEKSIGRSGDRFGMYSTSHSFFKPQKAAPAS